MMIRIKILSKLNLEHGNTKKESKYNHSYSFLHALHPKRERMLHIMGFGISCHLGFDILQRHFLVMPV